MKLKPSKIICLIYVVAAFAAVVFMGNSMGGIFYENTQIYSMEMSLIPALIAFICSLVLIYGGALVLDPPDETDEGILNEDSEIDGNDEEQTKPGRLKIFFSLLVLGLIIMAAGLLASGLSAEYYTEEGVEIVKLSGNGHYGWADVEQAVLQGDEEAPELKLIMKDGTRCTFNNGGMGTASDGFEEAFSYEGTKYIAYVSEKLKALNIPVTD